MQESRSIRDRYHTGIITGMLQDSDHGGSQESDIGTTMNKDGDSQVS